MAEAPDKLTAIQRIIDAHRAVMDALKRRQDALLARVIARIDGEQAKKIEDEIKKST
jgi:uncharacterized protein HemY